MKGTLNKVTVVFVLFSVLAVQAEAATLYDASVLDTPEVPVVDYTETPLGTLDSLGTYVSWLIEAASQLIRLINSIFEMLGMSEDTNVKELMEMYDSGMKMVET